MAVGLLGYGALTREEEGKEKNTWRLMGAEKRKKWIKLNAMGIVLHDFCGFYRRGKKMKKKKILSNGARPQV